MTNGDASRYFRLHLRAYLLGTGVLILVDLAVFDGWWFFWPILAWGILVLLHHLYVKSTRVDSDWADARAVEVRFRAYDLGHIESIQERYKDGAPTGRDKAKTKDDHPSSRDGPSDRGAK